jgi:prepilin-type N-terminal cleavage/methylation domain-containing protein
MRLGPPFQPGFTLIELLVAVGISALLVLGGLAAYRGIGEKQMLKQAGLELQTNLRAFQKKALSGEKPSGCTGVLDGFEVKYVSLISYQFQAICSLNSPAPTVVQLPNSGKVSFAAEFSPLRFEVLSLGVSGAQSIRLVSGSRTYQVTIEKSGVIEGDFYEE